MIRLVIVDDHPVVREGVKRILADTPDVVVVGEAANSRELFNIVAHQPCDLVLLDLLLPDRSGLEVLYELKHRFPDLPVVLFSIQPETAYAVQAFRAGAAGYLTKNRLPRELVRTVRQVARGKRAVSESLVYHLLQQASGQADTPLHMTLSPREYTVLCGIASGKPIKELGAELSVRPQSIATYRSRILQKLHLKTTADLIRYAAAHRLVD